MESKYKLGQAFAVKDLPVIARVPETAPLLSDTCSNVPPPLTTQYKDSRVSKFILTPSRVRSACIFFASLEDRGDSFVENMLTSIDILNPDTLAAALMQQLPRNLKDRGLDSIDHIIWRKFVIPKAKLGEFILKLHYCALSDDALCGQGAQVSLFSNFFVQKAECISGRDGSILDTIYDQIGAYLYEDEDGIGICRAGSASIGLRRRHNEHFIASK